MFDLYYNFITISITILDHGVTIIPIPDFMILHVGDHDLIITSMTS